MGLLIDLIEWSGFADFEKHDVESQKAKKVSQRRYKLDVK